MAKKLKAIVKLQLPAGKANPAPPVGTALGPPWCQHHGLCQGVQRPHRTARSGQVIPVEITIFTDNSFTFITKTPPAAGPDQEGGQRAEWQRRAEQDQGRQADTRRRCARSPRSSSRTWQASASKAPCGWSKARRAAWVSRSE